MGVEQLLTPFSALGCDDTVITVSYSKGRPRQMVEFDWDDSNRAHISEHGVSCAEAEQVLKNDPLDLDIQTQGGEERFLQIGETAAGRILIVVSVWREAAIRVITAFDAPRAMKLDYIAEKGRGYGSDAKSS